MKGLDTVESLSVEVEGSKVANFTVLVTLSSTLSKYFYFCRNDQKGSKAAQMLSKYFYFFRNYQKGSKAAQMLSKYFCFCTTESVGIT